MSPTMPTIYAKEGRLYCKVKRDGKWRAQALGLDDTPKNRRRATAIVEHLAHLLETGGPTPATVSEWAARWIEQRRRRGVSMVDEDEQRVRDHITPLLGTVLLEDLDAPRVRRFVGALRERAGARGRLAPRTVHAVYGTLRVMLRGAVAEGLLRADPCALAAGDLPAKLDKDTGWRAGAVFARDEIARLLNEGSEPVLWPLLCWTGMRVSEALALRWQDVESDRIHVRAAYNSKTHETRGPKSGVARVVPIHPALAPALPPRGEPGDLVLGRERTNYQVKDRLHADLRRLGLRLRRVHDLRRTFVSVGLDGGANPTHLRWVTHGPGKTIMDLYTTPAFGALAEAVGCVRYTFGPGLVRLPARGA